MIPVRMILESVENHTCKKINQIWLFKAQFHHKLPVLNMKIILVFRIILKKPLKLGNLKGKCKSHSSMLIFTSKKPWNVFDCLELRSKAKLRIRDFWVAVGAKTWIVDKTNNGVSKIAS